MNWASVLLLVTIIFYVAFFAAGVAPTAGLARSFSRWKSARWAR